MVTLQPVQIRNIVVVGKTGAGKSTVANKLSGSDRNFKLGKSTGSETSEVSHTQVKMTDPATNVQYEMKIIDTIGLFDTGIKITNKDVLEKIKKYFQDKIPEGVSLVLFVFRKGRFTREEKETFDFLVKNFHGEISGISALIITNCENESEDARRDLIEDFKKSCDSIASCMHKGIYTVGFPNTTTMKPKKKEMFEEDMEADINKLRDLAMKANEMRLGKELFEKSFWEKIGYAMATGCIIL